MTRQKFIGSWQLKSIVVAHNGHKIFPFGRHAKGLLIYLPNDYMSVQILMPRHYPITEKEKLNIKLEELAQTLKSTGYLAYFGRYEIDTNHQRVIHFVESSLAQPIMGKEEIRHYRFVDDKLILLRGNMNLTWLKI